LFVCLVRLEAVTEAGKKTTRVSELYMNYHVNVISSGSEDESSSEKSGSPSTSPPVVHLRGYYTPSGDYDFYETRLAQTDPRPRIRAHKQHQLVHSRSDPSLLDSRNIAARSIQTIGEIFGHAHSTHRPPSVSYLSTRPEEGRSSRINNTERSVFDARPSSFGNSIDLFA
jgi:hypothetical protein